VHRAFQYLISSVATAERINPPRMSNDDFVRSARVSSAPPFPPQFPSSGSKSKSTSYSYYPNSCVRMACRFRPYSLASLPFSAAVGSHVNSSTAPFHSYNGDVSVQSILCSPRRPLPYLGDLFLIFDETWYGNLLLLLLWIFRLRLFCPYRRRRNILP